MNLKSSMTGDLIQRLQALPGAMSQPILVRALKSGATVIQSRAAALAPRSSPDSGQPGHLADHIGVSVAKKVEGRVLGEQEAAVAVGPTALFWWGLVQEHGPHDGTYPAHPFMRPALDTGADPALRIVIDELWIALRAAAEQGFGAKFTSANLTGGGGTL